MLTADQQTEFETHGVLKVEGLLSDSAIARAEQAILLRFKSLGLAENGVWRLENHKKIGWPDKGYSAKKIGNKIAEVEKLLDETGIRPITGSLLDNTPFDDQMFKRPQVLVTLPNAGDWFMPHDGWHVDIARVPSGRRPGVQVFILLNNVKPGAGGTLVIGGSHQYLNDSTFVRSSDVTKALRTKPFFCEVMSGPHLSLYHDASAPELSVVELTGEAGDAYFMDMRCLHSAAPNASDQPRMMATHRFLRADIVPELMAR